MGTTIINRPINNITPKNLQNWKAIFLDNAEMAMEPYPQGAPRQKLLKSLKMRLKTLKKK